MHVTKKLKVICNKLNELTTYIKKLEDIKKKNTNFIFKLITIPKDVMDMFDKEELKNKQKKCKKRLL